LIFRRKLALGVTVVGDFSCQYEITYLLLHWLQWIDRGVGEKLVDKCFHMMESSDRDILLANIGIEDSYVRINKAAFMSFGLSLQRFNHGVT